MSRARSTDSLLRAAQLYYVEGHSQADVASAMGTSRPNVSRMLAEAQRQGIVEIRINHPDGRAPDLETRLERSFGLAAARVSRRSTARDPSDQVGEIGARLLVESLAGARSVALSWGRALQSVVNHVAVVDDHEITLWQLLGGISALGNEVSGQELVRQLAGRLGAHYRLLHAPATLQTPEAARWVTAENSVAGALRAAARAQVAVVGIGDPQGGSSAAVVSSMCLSAEELAAFRAARPVGDLAGRFFDAEGRPVAGPVDDRVVAVTLADLRDVGQVMGVATGRHKRAAVLGALRGGYLDSLVCDEGLAHALLEDGASTSDG